MSNLASETLASQLKLETKLHPFFSKFADFAQADQQDTLKILRKLHIQYAQEGLGALPSGYVSLDSGRPWICFWILHSLALLEGSLPETSTAADVVAFLDLCQSVSGGYGGSPGQLPHLAPSYAAVAALVSLQDTKGLVSIRRADMWRFLQSRCISASDGGGFAVCEGTQASSVGSFPTDIAIVMVSIAVTLQKHVPWQLE